MAGEIQFDGPGSGKTCYVLIRNQSGQVWNGTSFEVYLSANYSAYVVAVLEQGSASNYYVGTFPSAITAGQYSLTGKQQMGGSPAETDPNVANGDLQWNGSATLPLSNLATSGQIGQLSPLRAAYGTMIRPFPFKLVSSTDHITPFTSGIVSGQISRDGAAFGALQSGAFTEMGLGWYALQALTSGDMAGTAISLVFTATGVSGGLADQRDLSLITQRTSGQ